VEAICRIAQSTKTGSQHIGEKGIGFKSVFKAADVVWISSRNYSFKFDKNQQLGMIAPIWAEDFPGRKVPGHTSFFMKFSPSYDETALIYELEHTDPRVLLCLRKLREINIAIIGSRRIVPLKRQLRTTSHQNQNLITTLEENGDRSEYIVHRQVVKDLPVEKTRLGVSQSEILVAFPIPEKDQVTQLASQNVYNFLPIRDYDFKVRSSAIKVCSRTNPELVPSTR